ncbi:hypothetical protein F2Q70_00025842 [Brassica cretica]|uniref:Retrotransposon gag domain-containing protein n=1 Tax=Brassica cretica TaxID=69181 RepID=A0A8S9LB50_BRACR|nr:hypothetical protein F2Q70_00025842 [Brassica cretica]
MVEVLILKVDENGMLRDEEGRTRNITGQLINAEGAVIPDVIDVAETNDFDLNREWYDWGSVDPFRGLPHEDPIYLIKELEELASASEHNEVSVDHIICKIFPYSLSRDPFSWFSQLQPRSLTCWEDIKTAFLKKFLYEATATRQKEFDDMLDKMIKGQEKELMSSFMYCNNQDNILTESSMSGLDKLTFEPNNKAKSAFVLQLHMQSPYELVLLLCSHVLVSL